MARHRMMVPGSRKSPLAGCHALMATRETTLAEPGNVFEMIAEEYQEKGIPLPAATTEIVHT